MRTTMWAMAGMAAMALAACNAADKPVDAKTEAGAAAAPPADSVQVDVSVNKVYDANGNLVGYDSTSTSVVEPAAGKTGGGTGK